MPKTVDPLRVLPNEAKRLVRQSKLVNLRTEEYTGTAVYDEANKVTRFAVGQRQLDGKIKTIAHILVYDRTAPGSTPVVERVNVTRKK